MATDRYGAWRGGPDPLAPPYDVRDALDEIGDDVLAGSSPRAALNRKRPRQAFAAAVTNKKRRSIEQRYKPLGYVFAVCAVSGLNIPDSKA